MFKPLPYLSLVLLSSGMLLMGGCARYSEKTMDVEVADSGFYPNLDWLTNRSREDKLEALAHDNFGIIVAKVIDKRKGAAAAKAAESSRIMYEFNPDHLLQSLPYYVQNQLQKHMDFGRNKDHVYVAEVELTDARMRILKGDMINGKFGRYAISLQANVLVRDENSLILRQTPISIRHERQRDGDGGRQPSIAQDRARIVQALNEAFEPLALELAWETRRAHLRRNAADIGKTSLDD
jgi:hypothetical protein